ncbi:MAG: pentapeptide repeat-containing protein [Gammaproteobacteria bacterium]
MAEESSAYQAAEFKAQPPSALNGTSDVTAPGQGDTAGKPPDAQIMLEGIRGEAAGLRNFTITFLSLLVYVNLIVASTTHEQLLRVSPVTLPLLNVPISIKGFYAFMPWLLFFFHLYILLQHYLFSQHLFCFERVLLRQPQKLRDFLYRNLGNLPFLHWMIGRHAPAMRLLLTLITALSLMLWPLATLLWLQMGFLPFHEGAYTWIQRAAVIADVVIIAWIWPKTLDKRDRSLRWWLMPWLWRSGFRIGLWFLRELRSELAHLRRTLRWDRQHLTTACRALKREVGCLRRQCKVSWPQLPAVIGLSCLLLSAVFMSLAVSTLPDSPEENWFREHFSAWFETVDRTGRQAFWLTVIIHEPQARKVEVGDADWALHEYGYFPCPTAALETVFPAPKAMAQTNKPAPRVSSRRNREEASSEPVDRSHGILCLMDEPLLPRNLVVREKVITANAPNPELENALRWQAPTVKPKILAKVSGINLEKRDFRYADFSRSSFPKANLFGTRLHGAKFREASLYSVQLPHADVSLADFYQAHLQGANLSWAKMDGASLFKAQLHGAHLYGAGLRDADLAGTRLHGADLEKAQLHLANLRLAQLYGTNLKKAKLHRADLGHAVLVGADLKETQLYGADLVRAGLYGVRLMLANLDGADLSEAHLDGVILPEPPAPAASERSVEEIKAFKDALVAAALPQLQGSQGAAVVEKLVKVFQERIGRPVSFSGIYTPPPEAPCIRGYKHQEPGICVEWNEENNKKVDAYRIALACQDLTEGHWIARSIIQQQFEYSASERLSLLVLIDPDFAQVLNEKTRDLKNCPGLAGVPDEFKQMLRGGAR